MSMLDAMYVSFAGMQNGLSLVNTAAAAMGDPRSFGLAQAPASASPSLLPPVSRSMNVTAIEPGRSSGGEDQGSSGDGSPMSNTVNAVPAPTPLSTSAAPDLLSAVIDELMGKRIFELNARMISTQNKMLGDLINLK